MKDTDNTILDYDLLLGLGEGSFVAAKGPAFAGRKQELQLELHPADPPELPPYASAAREFGTSSQRMKTAVRVARRNPDVLARQHMTVLEGCTALLAELARQSTARMAGVHRRTVEKKES